MVYKSGADDKTHGNRNILGLLNGIGQKAEKKSFSRFIRELVKISPKPGYDGLLTALNDFDPLQKKHSFEFQPDVLRRLVLAGASAEDLHWLSKHDGYCDISESSQWFSASLAEAGINPAPLRRLVKDLNKQLRHCLAPDHAQDMGLAVRACRHCRGGPITVN